MTKPAAARMPAATASATTRAARKSSSQNVRPQLTNEMAEKYLPRVQRQAARVARKLPAHVNIGDLVSAGCCGLLDAFLKYDTARMDSFDAYVDHRIRGAILDELRAHDPLTRDQRSFARRVAAARLALSHRLGMLPDEHQLAVELGMTLAKYRRQIDRMHATASRSEAVSFDEDDDTISEPANDMPETLVANKEHRDRVHGAMDQLPPRMRQVLKLHYDTGKTLREIGDKLGVTESRVSQIHAEALEALRAVIATMEF